MPRRRIIDPSLWQDEGFAELSPRQQTLFIGLFSNADDEGRLSGSATAIRLSLPAVFGGAELAEIEADIEAVLRSMRRLVRYEVDGRAYLAFKNWARWQRIDRPSASDLPPPPEDGRAIVEPSPEPHIEGSDDSANTPGPIAEQSTNVPPSRDSRERKLSQEKSREGKGNAPATDLATDLDAMNVVLLPFANRGYVANAESLAKCAKKYPELDLEFEAMKLADWLRDRRNAKEHCSWRRIFNWLDRAEADRQRRLEDRQAQRNGTVNGAYVLPGTPKQPPPPKHEMTPEAAAKSDAALAAIRERIKSAGIGDLRRAG